MHNPSSTEWEIGIGGNLSFDVHHQQN